MLTTLSKTVKAQIKAIDIVIGDIFDKLKKQMKQKIPDNPTKTMGLYSVVSVAVDSKYDLTSNVDVADGLTNGSECVIKSIDYRVENSALFGYYFRKIGLQCARVANAFLLALVCEYGAV